ASTDVGALNRKIQLASQRMRAHQERTGVRHSEIMVFPQGRFSLHALRALKANNYLAAVNSRPNPSGPAASRDLSVLDFLGVAISRHQGFPVFLRRYPGDLEGCAFDLFFGKPLLIVEHHGYFQNGGRSLVEFVAKLNSLFDVRWTSLAEALTKSYLQRD